jgi:hypothetical protein
MAKRKDGKRKDKFDENLENDGMGPVDNEGVSEETGYNRGKKKEKTHSGEGIEEFIDDKPNFRDGEDDES